MLRKILLVLVLAVGGFLVYAATRPDTYRVSRSMTIAAPPPVVYAQLDDFKSWSAWSPWDKLDPTMKKTYEGPAEGVGASYSWQGNDKVGKGRMTITDAEPPKQIKYRLEFMEPFAAVAATTFDIAPAGEGASTVTWTMDGKNNLVGKVFGIFMDMDKTIGADFEKGLSGLKTVAETEGKKLADIEKARVDAAAAAAAKAQAEAAPAEAPAAAKPAPKGKKK